MLNIEVDDIIRPKQSSDLIRVVEITNIEGRILIWATSIANSKMHGTYGPSDIAEVYRKLKLI